MKPRGSDKAGRLLLNTSGPCDAFTPLLLELLPSVLEEVTVQPSTTRLVDNHLRKVLTATISSTVGHLVWVFTSKTQTPKLSLSVFKGDVLG